jgi:hypothetical protein
MWTINGQIGELIALGAGLRPLGFQVFGLPSRTFASLGDLPPTDQPSADEFPVSEEVP